MSKFGNLLCVLCLTAMGFAQTQLATPTPSLPQDKKMATLEKQHALDKVEGQIKDLTLQFQQLQAQAQGQLTQLTERQKKAQSGSRRAVCRRSKRARPETLEVRRRESRSPVHRCSYTGRAGECCDPAPGETFAFAWRGHDPEANVWSTSKTKGTKLGGSKPLMSGLDMPSVVGGAQASPTIRNESHGRSHQHPEPDHGAGRAIRRASVDRAGRRAKGIERLAVEFKRIAGDGNFGRSGRLSAHAWHGRATGRRPERRLAEYSGRHHLPGATLPEVRLLVGGAVGLQLRIAHRIAVVRDKRVEHRGIAGACSGHGDADD